MRLLTIRIISVLSIFIGFALYTAAHAASEVEEQARKLFSQSSYEDITNAISFFRQRKNTDSVGVLLLAMRFSSRTEEIGEALGEITGEQFGADWHQWMLWQERNPEIKPFAGFEKIHADAHTRIDGNFRLFLGEEKKGFEVQTRANFKAAS